MTGYVRVDTGNNIADGNVISAADLDNEFDGVVAAFNASTGHTHGGAVGEGAPIVKLGPTNDVTISASLLAPKTTNTVDVGSSSLKFKDLWLAGNASVGGTLAVTGATTLSAALTYGGVTLSNAVTGTGNMVLSASPTLTGTLSGANASLSGTLAVTGVATLTAQPILSSLTASRAVFTDGGKGLVSNAITGTGNVVMSASPTLTGTISAEALTTSSTVTLNGGTANGVAYLNGSKVLTTGSALTFDGTNLGVGNSTPSSYNGTAAQGVLAVGTTSGNRGVNVISGATSTGSYLFSDATNDRGGLIYYHTADVMAFLASGSEQMRLTSTGLGIGTSSPAYKLDVTGSGYFSDGVKIGTNSTAGSGRLFNNGTWGMGFVAASASTNAMGWFDSGVNNLMALSSSGNLGLGVTPSAWGAPFGSGVLEFSGGFLTGSSANNQTRYGLNSYYNGSSYIYKANGYAGAYVQNSGSHIWYTAPSGTAGNAISFTQAMTLDASSNLMVGGTSALQSAKITAYGSVAAQNGGVDGTFANAFVGVYSGNSNEHNVIQTAVSSGGTGSGFRFRASLGGGSSTTYPVLDLTRTQTIFYTDNTERARIDSSGNLLVAKTSSATSSVGFEARSNGVLSNTVNSITGVFINRLGNDGSLIDFQQDNTAEGSISVSGTTVSYNGGHLSRWAQTTGPKDESLVKGTVLSNLDEMNVYTDAEGNPVENEQLNKVKVSDVEGDANVAGVFVNWAYDDAHNVDEINMAMTGDMIIRIAQGVTIQRGDLLMSAGNGTAKPQGDDIVRSKTVAKVTSTHVTCTYEDGSYCVPCVLMAC